MNSTERVLAIIAENEARDPHFYSPPEVIERLVREQAAKAPGSTPSNYRSRGSNTAFRPYGAYGSNNSPYPLDWGRG